MQARLRDYIEDLLAGMDETDELQEFKYELVMNLSDKVDDLLADGLTEEEAFREAVATLGDLRTVFTLRQSGDVLSPVSPLQANHVATMQEPNSRSSAPLTTTPDGARKRRTRDRDYTGALFVLSVAAYIALGLLKIAGGFKVWWTLPIAVLGFSQLLEREFSGAIMLLSLAVSCFLVITGVLSSWWWVLAMLIAATGVIALIEA